ncbi:hypothetical protein ERJ75_001032400 [Trypanosoma vivax]|uniref:Variant surface glycoprotein (VSG) n=1 Tax=Trypanosoma vivax (strain Y486) TaxID=1055687 RepID=F9WLK0_TRYVY|nr:hypothetical protein ERJ75_001032400 [Trypanosoma vivax]CCD18392.1 hypothetical protein, conserved in T. vivax [Trypanosoma vivax Y486]|eukprot:CCD18392.1 hypothetical protein, conserved in T. vivax [Trypanosoma vivax Y486]
MGKLCCIVVCLFALAAAACEATAPKGLKTADGAGLCKYAGALRFAGRYASSLAREAERRAATAEAVKELASLAESLAGTLEGANESVVAAVAQLQRQTAETAEKALREQARLASQAARALTVGSGSLRSFVELLAALGTSAQSANAYSCIDGEQKLPGTAVNADTNANTLREKTCKEVADNSWTEKDPLNESAVKKALEHLKADLTLKAENGNIGKQVTPKADQPECRLLDIAGQDTPGDGGLLLTTKGSRENAENTVHLGTFVKISALTGGGSASFDKTQPLAGKMRVAEAVRSIETTHTTLENHKAFACSETGCPKLEAAKQTLRRTVAAIQHAEERDKSGQKEERTARERTETQMKARDASERNEKGTQAQAHTENEQTGYAASDASQGVPFAATLAVAAAAATTHFVPQQAARH